MSIKKKISLVLGIFMLLIMMNGMAMGESGTVFAADSNGNDVNFKAGTDIYIKGNSFVGVIPFHWYIYDMNPPCYNQGPEIGCGTLVEEGIGTTNSDGEIEFMPTGFATSGDTYHYKLYVLFRPGDTEAQFHNVDTFKGVAIPEFPSIALPIAVIVGLMFFFQSRKTKAE